MKNTISILVILLAFVGTASATVDLALEDLQATGNAEAYSAVALEFKVRNVGDEQATTGLSVQMFTEKMPEGSGIYNILLLSKSSNAPITQVTIYKPDGTTRIEKVEERWMKGKDIKNGVESDFTQPVDSVVLYPGEYVIVKDSFYFRNSEVMKPGQHKAGLRFVGMGGVYADRTWLLGETPEITFANNELLTTVFVQKRQPLVEQGPLELDGGFELEENQYLIRDYWEYYENGTLCADVAGNEVCVLQKFDGKNFPFTINGEQKKLDWKAKLFYKYVYETNDEKSGLYKVLADFIHFEIDGVTVYLTGAPGWLVEIEE